MWELEIVLEEKYIDYDYLGKKFVKSLNNIF